MSRLETAVHNVTKRLVEMSEKVSGIETELSRRRMNAEARRKQRHQRIQGTHGGGLHRQDSRDRACV